MLAIAYASAVPLVRPHSLAFGRTAFRLSDLCGESSGLKTGMQALHAVVKNAKSTLLRKLGYNFWLYILDIVYIWKWKPYLYMQAVAIRGIAQQYLAQSKK